MTYNFMKYDELKSYNSDIDDSCDVCGLQYHNHDMISILFTDHGVNLTVCQKCGKLFNTILDKSRSLNQIKDSGNIKLI